MSFINNLKLSPESSYIFLIKLLSTYFLVFIAIINTYF